MASSDLKSAALLDQMKTHFSTDAGKALTKKIGLVYQIHIAPKVEICYYYILYFLKIPNHLQSSQVIIICYFVDSTENGIQRGDLRRRSEERRGY